MIYSYHKPPAKALPWWKQWRILLGAAIVGLSLLHTICTPILNYYHQRRRDARGGRARTAQSLAPTSWPGPGHARAEGAKH